MAQVQMLPDSPKGGIDPPNRSGRDLSIDHLRTAVTIMVIAVHSGLAYTTGAYFDKDRPFSFPAPVVDVTRWRPLNFLVDFNDAFLMALMFFLSGVFVYPALKKHGTIQFIRDRLLRLGVPFAFVELVLMPIAYYPSWKLAGRDAGFVGFYKMLALRGFQVGPPWFIWVLLLFDVVLAIMLSPFKSKLSGVGRKMRDLNSHAVGAFLVMVVLAALVYLPSLAHYGATTWTFFFTSPFSFQGSRIGLYAVWFVFGVLAGMPGISDGLLSREGSLARHWRLWALGWFVGLIACWSTPRFSLDRGLPASAQWTVEALLWVVSSAAGSFGSLALIRGVGFRSRPWMLPLDRGAYVMYLVHYVFVTWLQLLLFGRPFPAAFKFVFVFLLSTLLSWFTAQCLLRVPKLRTIL